MADFQLAMDLYVFSGKLDSTMHFVSKKRWAFFVPCDQQKYSPLKLKYCTWFTWISNVVTLTRKGTNPKCSIHTSYGVTHLKFKIAPEKWWLEDYFPIGKISFQGLCYTFGGVFGFSKTSGAKNHCCLTHFVQSCLRTLIGQAYASNVASNDQLCCDKLCGKDFDTWHRSVHKNAPCMVILLEEIRRSPPGMLNIL